MAATANAKKLTKAQQRKLYEIAAEHIPAVADRGDLEARKCDSMDFLDVGVWSIESALEAAFNLGRASVK